PQGEILDRANSHEGDRQLDARDLARETEVRRIDELQHLAGQTRVGFDRLSELRRTVVRVLRQFKQADRALRQSRKLSTTKQFLQVGSGGWHSFDSFKWGR